MQKPSESERAQSSTAARALQPDPAHAEENDDDGDVQSHAGCPLPATARCTGGPRQLEQLTSAAQHASLSASSSVVVQLQAHPVLDLVILQGDVVLVDVVPLLDADLFPASAALGRD
ncbi:unnamed protein product [Prorocentrum cordatum]|uniref:Uncharacterized protein n=1 Tax=Prorocentrum cordatum TaxID=2364126 RepID=A0ABN9U3R1_9DINO|nr:unnamed protein product [Polarella glacialis]